MSNIITKPGSDLVSKALLKQQKVMNIITEATTNAKDDYLIGNCEWADGTRSDMVLEPKEQGGDLPPIIIEIQKTVDAAFIKRAINYCMQAYKRYGSEPILVIFSINKLSEEVREVATPGTITGFLEVNSKFWAERCYVFSAEQLAVSPPLPPLVALGLFFSCGCLSLDDHPHSLDWLADEYKRVFEMVYMTKKICDKNIDVLDNYGRLLPKQC